MLRLFVMRKGCVSYMKFVLVMNLFLHKGFLFSFWKMHDNLNFSLMIVWRGIYCFNNCYFWLSDIYGFYLLWLQCNLSYIWMFLAIYGSSVAVFSHITYIKIVWGCNLNMYELSDLFEIDIFSSIGSNFEPYI